jgi:hypothetical protein
VRRTFGWCREHARDAASSRGPPNIIQTAARRAELITPGTDQVLDLKLTSSQRRRSWLRALERARWQ